MASIRKDPKGRSPYWYACFEMPNGKRTQRSTKTTSRQEALRMAFQMEDMARDAKSGRLTEKLARKVTADIFQIANKTSLPSSTTRSFLNAWLERKEIENKPNTYLRYKLAVKHFLAYLGELSDRDISHLDASSIAHVRDCLSQDKSPSTANHTVKTIRAALNQAKRDGLIDENEASKVTLLKCKANRRRAFTIDQIKTLLSVASHEWRGIILMGIYIGQRLGDIATIDWSNIDWNERQIHLYTEKNGRHIQVPIADPLMDYLESLPVGDDPKAPIFPKASKTVLNQEGRVSSLSGQFRRLMESAGLVSKRTHQSTGKGRDKTRTFNELTFHSLRHTATSLFKEAGVPHVVVQDIIGHESEAVSRIYTHVGDQAKRDAISKLPLINA
jgi:integrase